MPEKLKLYKNNQSGFKYITDWLSTQRINEKGLNVEYKLLFAFNYKNFITSATENAKNKKPTINSNNADDSEFNLQNIGSDDEDELKDSTIKYKCLQYFLLFVKWECHLLFQTCLSHTKAFVLCHLHL